MDRTTHGRRAAVILLAGALAVAAVLSLKENSSTAELLGRTSSEWAKTVISKAFEKSALKPIYLPDTSATEKGVEAAEAVARFLNAKDGSRDSSSDDVVNVERIHTSDKSVSQARPEASVQHAKPKSKNLMDISKVDDSEAKDYVRLFPIYEPKPSDSEAAAAAAAAAAELQESAAELPLPQDTPTRPIIYRSASWPAPPPPQPIKRYRAASPAIETDSDANAASDDGAEMVEVPIPLQDLSPPSNAVARSFPTPFSAYDFGRTEPEVEAEPGARFQPSKEDSETTEDSADSNSYQVKVRLPARPLTYGRWANNRVGSINVNFAADDEKVGEGEKNIVEEGPPAPDSEADDKKEQVEQTEDEKEGETDTEEVRKVEEEERKEEEEVQAAEQAEANAKVREEEEEQEEENSVQAVDDHAAPAAAAVQLPSDSFEEPAAAALWSYRGSATGPTRWGELGYPACGSGKAQSPINIEFNVEPASLPPIAWRVPEDSDASQSDGRAVSAARVFYNGRAVVVAGLDAVLAVGGGEEYALRAIHVHTPSEHAVGGLHYDMELHFVHSAVVEGQIRYMIMAAFFSRSEASADFITGLASALPSLSSRGEAVDIDFPAVAMAVLGQMAPVRPTATNAESYYAYEGSFTAPPCAEGVAWRVLKNPLPVAAADLLAFRRVQGSNNRPPQPLDGRPVLDSSPAPAGP